MGRLTDEMTRLCGEIVALHKARKGFIKDLTHNVAAMKANFRRAHAERRAAVAHLKKTVAADLEGARRAWAGK